MNIRKMVLGGLLSIATLAFLLGAVMDLGSLVSFGATTTNTVSGTTSVPSVCAISTVSNTALAFGGAAGIAPGQNVATANTILITDSGGNTASNILVYGGYGTSPGLANSIWRGSSASNTIGIANTLWNPSSSGSYVGNALSNTLTDTKIVLSAPTQGSPSTTVSIFFGMAVPSGTPADTYTTNIVLETTC